MKELLIDEIILITIITILLKGNSSLFIELLNQLKFEPIGTKNFLNQFTWYHYKRKQQNKKLDEHRKSI